MRVSAPACPLTLFNTLITVQIKTATMAGLQRGFSGRKVFKTDVEPRFGVGQPLAQGRTRSVCLGVLRSHNQRNFMLDNSFSPAYGNFMKKDRLHNEPSIIS